MQASSRCGRPSCVSLMQPKTHRRVRRKLTLVYDPWFVGCNQGAGINCTPIAFLRPLMGLRFLRFFVKYLLWFGALLLGYNMYNEGRVLPMVLPSYGIFQTSWVKPAPLACQPKNKAAKTPQAKNRAKSAALRARHFIRVKSYCILFSNIKSPKCLWTPPIPRNGARSR